MTNFEQAMARLLPIEGGYVNDPNDPGGETKYGICKRDHPDVDIANLTPEGAMAIYKAEFWDVIEGDLLPFSVADQLLDFAVNGGIQTSIRKGQDAVGVADDGHWGPVTRAAVKATNPAVFCLKFAALKIRYYTKLTKFSNYGAGWMNRVATDLEYASQDVA